MSEANLGGEQPEKSNRERIEDILKAIFSEVLEVETETLEIDRNKSFKDQGFDSLHLIETAEGLEEVFPDIRIDDEKLGEFVNPADVVDYLEDLLNNGEIELPEPNDGMSD